MRILIANDNGVFAPGLGALYRALSQIADVMVVAPDSEQSGASSAIHVSQPLQARRLDNGFIAVNGSPSDCVHLAIYELFDRPFDVVITGINAGGNLGYDVMYSGTFGAAISARLAGIPAIAVSLVGGVMDAKAHDHHHYETAAAAIVQLMDQGLLQHMSAMTNHVININVPKAQLIDEIKGVLVTRLAKQTLAQPVIAIQDPRGRAAFWLSLKKQPLIPCEDAALPMTDAQAVQTGHISITPVRLPAADTAAISKLGALSWRCLGA